MVMLKWDESGKRYYETGVQRGVLSVQNSEGAYAKPVAWSGLIAVSQTSEGGSETSIYANNGKYLSLRSSEEAKGTIKAYSYPVEFRECDGSKQIAPGIYLGQQGRKPFGFAYETLVGNDTQGTDFSRTLHLAYGCTASVANRDYETINNDPKAIELSWEYTTTKDDSGKEGFKPSSTLEVSEHEVGKEKYKKLTDKLYGTASTEPQFPKLSEVITLLTTDSD